MVLNHKLLISAFMISYPCNGLQEEFRTNIQILSAVSGGGVMVKHTRGKACNMIWVPFSNTVMLMNKLMMKIM